MSGERSAEQVAQRERNALLNYLATRPDVHDVRDHLCRCVTYFDVALWRSVTAEPCARHANPSPATTRPNSAATT